MRSTTRPRRAAGGSEPRRGPLFARQGASNAGFTLVELLFVVVVIGILAAIGIAAYSEVRQMSQDRAALSDIRNAATAIELYYRKNDSYPSSVADLKSEGYTTSEDVSFTEFSTSTSPGGSWEVTMRANHAASNHYYEWTYPTESAPQQKDKP